MKRIKEKIEYPNLPKNLAMKEDQVVSVDGYAFHYNIAAKNNKGEVVKFSNNIVLDISYRRYYDKKEAVDQEKLLPKINDLEKKIQSKKEELEKKSQKYRKDITAKNKNDMMSLQVKLDEDVIKLNKLTEKINLNAFVLERETIELKSITELNKAVKDLEKTLFATDKFKNLTLLSV